MVTRFSAMGVAVSFAMLVAGCGGGGGGGSVVVAGIPPTLTADQAPRATAAASGVANMPAQTVMGSDGSPTGITQATSNADKVYVTVDDDDRTKYTIVNSGTSGWTISPGDDGVNPRSLPFVGTGLNKEVTGGTVSVDYYDGYHTKDEDGETDYLAGGVWLYVPTGSAEALSFGAFVSGNSPYDDTTSLTEDATSPIGKATYSGPARGVYLDNSGKKLGYLDGKVSLTANFDERNISGDISDILLDRKSATGKLELGTANFGTINDPFTDGKVTGTVDIGTDDEVKYTGNWGGQFFGTHDVKKEENEDTTTTTYPGYVGGTFAATPDGDAEGPSFLGIILPGFSAVVPPSS